MVHEGGRSYGRRMLLREPSTSRAARRVAWIGAVAALAAAILLPGVARMAALVAAPRPAAPAGLPECQVTDIPARHTGYDEWADTLLDVAYALDRSYVPPDLVELPLPGKGIRLRSFVVADLLAMLEAARREGNSISVSSGYRSYEQQERIFRSLSETHGEGYALLSAARPGHSEHQLGTTVDLNGGAAWLAEHAWRFGFALSYPPGRSPATTCYKAEVWHYRYFGRERAAAMQISGLSPREWLWQQSQAESSSSSGVRKRGITPAPASHSPTRAASASTAFVISEPTSSSSR